MRAKAHSWEQTRVTVDTIQRKKHGLQTLDAAMFIDRTTLLCWATLLMYRKQPTQNQVPFQGQHLLGWAFSHSAPQQQQSQEPKQ